MLSSIFISALLAGPVVAGVIPRQNTVTVKHTVVTSVIATSTVIEYATSGTPAAFAAELSLNPINGLPAAPPQKPESAASPSLVFKTFTSSPGAAAPIATNNPSRILLPAPLTSLPVVTKTKTKTPAASSTPLVFKTFTSPNGAPAPTATNNPKRILLPAPLTSLPVVTKISSYSSLLRAPPQLSTPLPFSITPSPEETSTKKVASKPTSSSAPLPPPPPPPPPPAPTSTEEDAIPSDSAALFTSKTSGEASNPYPYPTPGPKEPKPSNYVYPYPPKE
jgi:hypothetical protein